MKKIKSSISTSIIVILAFVFNILIFAPIEIYFTNRKEFWFTLKDILPVIIYVAIAIFIILFLIGIILKNKKRDIYVRIIFALLTALYIQGNFLNFGYDVLDGSKVQWETMIMKGTYNTCMWVLIIGLPYCIKKLKENNNFRLFMIIVSVFIMLIETITLTTLVLNKNNKIKFGKGLSNQNIFNLSKDENIVVFMSDTFEATYMNKLIEEMPEYKEKLKDFTYFDNCTGVSFFTYSSMPTLLTGVECEVGNTLDENLEYCFNNSILYDVLKENGYETEIYTERALQPMSESIDNLKETNSFTTLKTKSKIAKQMYKCSMYRYLPHFLKASFTVSNDEFNAIKSSDETYKYLEKTYFLDDVAFNDALIETEISSNKRKKEFKFYEMNGIHVPCNTTQDLKYDNSEEYSRKDNIEKRYNEAIASINLLCNYIEELKKEGIYDNTTIIFLADHGENNRFYTNLLVKKANDKHEFKISSAPVSLLEDLVPTILNIATNSKQYGKDFFDYNEGEERTRKVYDYIYETEMASFNDYTVISKIVFETQGEAKNVADFYKVSEEHSDNNKILLEKYNFDEVIEIDNIRKQNSINLIGFSLDNLNLKVSKGVNIGNEAYIEINTKKSNNDITAKIELSKVYGKQNVNFKIEGKTIHTCELNEEDKNIEFKIPKEIWNKNEILTIEMEFPDGKLGEVFPTTMTAICLEKILFSDIN